MSFQRDNFSCAAPDKLFAAYQPKNTPKIPPPPPKSLVEEADFPVAPTHGRDDPFFTNSMLTTADTYASKSTYEPVEKHEYQQRPFPAPGFPFIANAGDRPLPSLSPLGRNLKSHSDRISGLSFDDEFQLPVQASGSTPYPSPQCERSYDGFVPSPAQTSLSPPQPIPSAKPITILAPSDAAASKQNRRPGTSSRATANPMPLRPSSSKQFRERLFRNHLDQQTARDTSNGNQRHHPHLSHPTASQHPPYIPPHSSRWRAYPPRARFQPATGEGMRSWDGNGGIRAPPGIFLSDTEREMTIHMWRNYL